MKKLLRNGVPLGSLVIVVGLSLAFGGTNWLENRFGISPDGGNGSLELAIASVVLVLGAVLLAPSIVSWVGERVRRTA